jgi:WhiB family redox-sensing transcriptional regulator
MLLEDPLSKGSAVELVLSQAPILDQDWRSSGLCAATDPDLWFAVGAVEHREAKSICRRCPVRSQCLAYAMEAPVDHGIWGGMTERERRRYRRKAANGDWRAAIAGVRIGA